MKYDFVTKFKAVYSESESIKMKKVTIHDVAKEAGVSAATVSYIINNRTDQTISNETKQKVWHVINMLNYKPSIYAKSLRSAPESKLVAVCSDHSNELSRAEFFSVMRDLENAVAANYSLIFSGEAFKRFTNADCIVAIGVSKADFYKIGEANYIPLIAVDSFIDDKLFFQVNTNLSVLKENADRHLGKEYTFVSITPRDDTLKEKIQKIFPRALFAESFKELDAVKTENVLTVNDVIRSYLTAGGVNVYMPEPLSKRRFSQVSTCIKQALSHEQFDVHAYEV